MIAPNATPGTTSHDFSRTLTDTSNAVATEELTTAADAHAEACEGDDTGELDEKEFAVFELREGEKQLRHNDMILIQMLTEDMRRAGIRQEADPEYRLTHNDKSLFKFLRVLIIARIETSRAHAEAVGAVDEHGRDMHGRFLTTPHKRGKARRDDKTEARRESMRDGQQYVNCAANAPASTAASAKQTQVTTEPAQAFVQAVPQSAQQDAYVAAKQTVQPQPDNNTGNGIQTPEITTAEQIVAAVQAQRERAKRHPALAAGLNAAELPIRLGNVA